MTGAAIGSAAIGGASLYRGNQASDDAAEAGDKAIRAAEGNVGTANELNKYLSKVGEQGTEFAQRMLDDWEGTFGGIQENLADYYQNLDPTKYSTEAKAQYGQSMDKQMKQFNESMATQGLQSAGMKQQAALESTFQQAEGNAAIDLAADDKVMGMKQGFLNSGENQRNQATGAMQNAIGNQGNLANTGATAMMNANNSVANAYTGQAQQYSQSSAGYMGAAGNMFGSSLGLGLNGAFDSKKPADIPGRTGSAGREGPANKSGKY